MVIETQLHAVPFESLIHSHPSPIHSHREKLLLLQARMAARKRSLAACMPSRRPFKKRCFVPKKAVRFDEDHNSVHYRHASREDLFNTWLQQNDYHLIREENRATLKALNKAKGNISHLDATQLCVRGLEEQISVYLFNSSRDRQRKFVKIILVQYKFQRKCGFWNPDSLCMLSASLSKQDRAKALKIATIDAFC